MIRPRNIRYRYHAEFDIYSTHEHYFRIRGWNWVAPTQPR